LKCKADFRAETFPPTTYDLRLLSLIREMPGIAGRLGESSHERMDIRRVSGIEIETRCLGAGFYRQHAQHQAGGQRTA
jgi:hypothetical protein